MSDQELSATPANTAAKDLADRELKSGSTPQEVQSLLMRQGMDHETAGSIVAELLHERLDATRAAGRKNMLFGTLWFIGGTVVTIGTFAMAVRAGGGTYLIAWGAVVFGAIQFFRGLNQARGNV